MMIITEIMIIRILIACGEGDGLEAVRVLVVDLTSCCMYIYIYSLYTAYI